MIASDTSIPDVLRLVLPTEHEIPLLLDSPHSGTAVPADFGCRLDSAVLRRIEDPFVNELFGGASACGATWLEALFTRNYIDPNRSRVDVDPELVDEPFPGGQPRATSVGGRGLIWRLTPDGLPFYDRRLSVAEVSRRIEKFWLPYHETLVTQLRRLHGKFGQVWHLNCHSMPGVSGKLSPDGRAGMRRPDFVLGNHDGSSCAATFIDFVHATLKDMGYSVANNFPYKGQELTSAYSRPALGFHSLQIEVNCDLYLDEAMMYKTKGFDTLRARMDELVQRIGQFVLRQNKMGVRG